MNYKTYSVHLLSWLERVAALGVSHSEEGRRESRVAASWEGVWGTARISPGERARSWPHPQLPHLFFGEPHSIWLHFKIKKVLLNKDIWY